MHVQGRHKPPGPCVTGPGADDNTSMAGFVRVRPVFMVREANNPLPPLVSPAPGPMTTQPWLAL